MIGYNMVVDEQELIEKLNKEYYSILRRTGMNYLIDKLKQSNNIIQAKMNIYYCLCCDLGFSLQIDVNSKDYIVISIIKYEFSQIIILNGKEYNNCKQVPTNFQIYKSTPIKDTIKKIEKEIKRTEMQYHLKKK